MNTFRRLDLLEIFLDHYQTCRNVKQIQVIWSDQTKGAPLHWLSKYPKDKVLFEIHTSNSLNNRFHALVPVPTEVLTLHIVLCNSILSIRHDDPIKRNHVIVVRRKKEGPA